MVAGTGTVLAILGIGLAYLMYSAQSISAAALTMRLRPIYLTLFNRYWIDELYCWFMDKFIIAVAFGMGWLERDGGLVTLLDLPKVVNTLRLRAAPGRGHSHPEGVAH